MPPTVPPLGPANRSLTAWGLLASAGLEFRRVERERAVTLRGDPDRRQRLETRRTPGLPTMRARLRRSELVVASPVNAPDDDRAVGVGGHRRSGCRWPGSPCCRRRRGSGPASGWRPCRSRRPDRCSPLAALSVMRHPSMTSEKVFVDRLKLPRPLTREGRVGGRLGIDPRERHPEGRAVRHHDDVVGLTGGRAGQGQLVRGGGGGAGVDGGRSHAGVGVLIEVTRCVERRRRGQRHRLDGAGRAELELEGAGAGGGHGVRECRPSCRQRLRSSRAPAR